MLLRSLSQHLRAQNWTAVCLDLLIVVVGIFLGLQVSQWYERQQEIGLEASILERLREEFETISAEADSAVRVHQEEIVALELIKQFLKAGSLDPDDEPRFREGLLGAMNYELGPSRSGTYIEILSSGQFRLLGNQDLRSALSSYDDLVLKGDSLFSIFQQNQRKYETVFNRYFERGPSQKRDFDSMPTGIVFLHGEIDEMDFDAMASDEQFLDAIGRLIEYHINFQFWHGKISQSADRVLDLLEADDS